MSILEQAIKQPGVYVAQGWQCPLCKRIWSPTVQWCTNHVAANQIGPAMGGVAAGVVGGLNADSLRNGGDAYL